ncbi:MAG: SMP-30/gluconolactonase/LRE family protein, partial [Candidatus Solibacter sp.]
KGWELLGRDYQLTADSAVDKQGKIYFTDAQKDRILTIDLEGKIALWKQGSHGSHGVAFGPDGRLYAGQHDLKRVVAFSPTGVESVIAEGAQTHHLTVTARNHIYFTDPPAHKVWLLDAAGRKRLVHEGLEWPRGLRVTPDQTQLLVADSRANRIWSFRIEEDGSLTGGKAAYEVETRAGSPDADIGGMTFDSEGFLYVATKFGVQVFDRQARVAAIVDVASSDGVANVMFAGPGLQWLYAMEWNKVYRRPMRRTGVDLLRKAAPRQ